MQTKRACTRTWASFPPGIWQALICTAAGLAVAIPAHAGYNYLVSRVNSIVLDMERVGHRDRATSSRRDRGQGAGRHGPHEVPPPPASFGASWTWPPLRPCFFLLLIFLMLGSPGLHPGRAHPACRCRGLTCTGTPNPTVSVAVDADGRLYYENQWIEEAQLR